MKLLIALGSIVGAFVAFLMTGKLKLTEEQKDAVWLGLIIYFYACLTLIDFIVVGWLGEFGLQWSDIWAMPYWITLALIYVSITFLVTWHYYMATDNLKNSVKYGAVVFFSLIGAFLDWIWFLYAMSVYPMDAQWTWMWQYMVFGWWNGWAQVVWSLLMLVVLIVVWKKLSR